MSKGIRLLAPVTCIIAVFPLAAEASSNATLATLSATIIRYFNVAAVLFMGLAVLMFIWYVIQYYIKPNEERAKAGLYVMWATIGFFVILSMWGLVNVLGNTFVLGQGGPSSWSSLGDLMPGGSGSFGNSGGLAGSGSNLFNQGSAPSNNVSSGNYGSTGGYGTVPGGTGLTVSNPFSSSNPGGQAPSHGAPSNGTPSNGANSNGTGSAKNAASGSATGPCSKYFNVCVAASSVTWTVLSDSNEDFDLIDKKDGITIGVIYSNLLSFVGSGQPFTIVSLLGQSLPAYKKTANGVTMVIAGMPGNGATLIVTVFSNSDISAAQAVSFFRGIKIRKQ